MLCARIARRARGLVSALFAPVPQANNSGLRHFSDNTKELKLGDILEALIKGAAPTQDDRAKRLRIIDELNQSLGKTHLGPTIDIRILPFGSFVNSLYEPNSDLDLAIVGQIVATDDLSPDDKRHAFLKLQLAKLPREYASEILRTAMSQFVEDGLADERSLVPVLHARVPILKFVHPATGVNVDVCVGSEGDAFKTWSLAQLMALHPAVEPLCRLVKIWARAHGINDPRSFTFNSWCLTLLVVFFFQRHSQPELLPPLKALIYDYVGAPGALIRLMHGGRLPPNKRIVRLMDTATKNAGPARETYGQRAAKPLELMFLDFLDSNAALLRAAIEDREPLKRGTAISVFYGDFHTDRHFREHALFVEDPLNDLDNTARTLRGGAASGSSRGSRTIDYVGGTFSKSAGRLRAHLEGAGAAPAPPAVQGEASPPAPAATTASGRHGQLETKLPGDGGGDGGDGDSVAAAAVSRASASPASSGSSSLAATAVFLFGTELISRLPELSERLLGPKLCEWARAALLAGRPAGEVHRELLQRLGADKGFEPFVNFRKRCKIRVLDEEEHWTPEELELLIRKQVRQKARLEREAVAKEREEAIKARKRAHKARRMERQRQGQGQQRTAAPQAPGTKESEGWRRGEPAGSPAKADAGAATTADAAARPPRRASSPRPASSRSGPDSEGGAAAAARQ